MVADSSLWEEIALASLLGGSGIAMFGYSRMLDRYRELQRLRTWHRGDVVSAHKHIHIDGEALITPSLTPDTTAEEEVLQTLLVAQNGSRLHYTFSWFGKERRSCLSEQPDRFWFASGNQVVLTIADQDALYRCQVEVRDLWREPGIANRWHIELRRPMCMARVQRRQFERAEVPVETVFLDEQQLAETILPVRPKLEGLKASVLNLSGGGACLDLSRTFGPDECARITELFHQDLPIRLKLCIPDSTELTLPVKIKNIQKICTRGGLGIRLSCEFTQIEYAQQQQLISVVRGALRGHKGRHKGTPRSQGEGLRRSARGTA